MRDNSSPPATSPEPQRRLLLVDDEYNNRLSLSRRLERRGYAVETAESGAEALDRLLHEQYDLLLLDQMMPGMSGLDLLKLVRATYSPAELPVIMVTAVDENRTMAQALEEGANDYVLKPVEMPDITTRIQTQLQRSQARADQRGHGRRNPGEAVWEWDPESNAARYSEGWAKAIGCSPSELQGCLDTWLDRIHPDDLARVRRELNAHLEGGSTAFRCEHRLRLKNGVYRWMEVAAKALRDPEGRLVRLKGTLIDLPNRHGADPLTGLRGRSHLIAQLERAISRARKGDAFAVLLLDLDDFRMLNEHAGHQLADEVLLEVSVRLRNLLASEPYLGKTTLTRVGSDEFVIVASYPRPCERDVETLAEAVLRCFHEPVLCRGEQLRITGALGTAVGSTDLSPDRLLRDADLALRQAQRQGRLAWCQFEPALRNRALMRSSLIRDLQYAVERKQLLAVYQPKVQLRTGRVAGFEALLRWRHPVFGVVSPADFIPIAEQSGEILAAGEWIVRQACQQLKNWQAFRPDLEMSVNLSPRQVSDPNLLSIVKRVLEETGCPSSSLALELTETSLIEEEEHARTVLTAMRKLGVRLMLDDFGTGYASLSYLNALRFDSLKIDRSFVSHMDADAHCAAIVRNILNLVRELKMDVVAEGIETERQRLMLIEMGCETGQGYYFSRPVDAGRAELLLERESLLQTDSVEV